MHAPTLSHAHAVDNPTTTSQHMVERFRGAQTVGRTLFDTLSLLSYLTKINTPELYRGLARDLLTAGLRIKALCLELRRHCVPETFLPEAQLAPQAQLHRIILFTGRFVQALTKNFLQYEEIPMHHHCRLQFVECALGIPSPALVADYLGFVPLSDHDFHRWQRLLAWWRYWQTGPAQYTTEIDTFFEQLHHLGWLHIPQSDHCVCREYLFEIFQVMFSVTSKLHFTRSKHSLCFEERTRNTRNIFQPDLILTAADNVVPSLKVETDSGFWILVFEGFGVVDPLTQDAAATEPWM